MNILRLINSPRGEASYSIKLGNAIVERLRETHPDSILKTRNVSQHPFPYLEEAHLTSFFTPKESYTPELAEAVKHSDEAIEELANADVIVIDTPMYNFGITATQKSWIDHIVRVGKTFKYSEAGAEGLVINKKVYLAISTGGIYTEGPMMDFDFTEKYLRVMLGFLGMTNITAFRVEGTNRPELRDGALPKALVKVNQFNF